MMKTYRVLPPSESCDPATRRFRRVREGLPAVWLTGALGLSACCGEATAPPPAAAAPIQACVAGSEWQASRLRPDEVVARWSGGELTYRQLLEQQGKALSTQRASQVREQVVLEQSLLRDLLDEALVAKAAAAADTTPAAFLSELDDAVEVSEAEVKTFYEMNLEGEGIPFDEVRIREYLTNSKREVARRMLFDELERDANARLALPMPQEARIDFDLKGHPSKGSADAPLTLVIFSDYQCPYCAEARRVADELLQEFPKQLRVVVMHYPLDSHPASRLAAWAAECAYQQGRFWPMHAELYEHQATLEPDRAIMIGHARAVGLDVKAFESCLDKPSTHDAVERDVAAGDAAGIRGTPAVFINGLPQQGMPSEADLRLQLPAAR